MVACPSRSLPHILVVGTQTPQRGPSTPPQNQGPVLPTHTASPCPVTTYIATGSTSSEGYTSSQALPKIATMPPLTGTHTILPPPRGEPPPVPHQWIPKFIPEKLDMHGWLRHRGIPQTRGGRGPRTHRYHHIYRRSWDGRNPHHHEGRTRRHTHGSYHFRCARMDRHIHRISIQFTSHTTPPHSSMHLQSEGHLRHS